MKKWLQPDAEKLCGFTHIVFLLRLVQQIVIVYLFLFFFFEQLLNFIVCSHIHHLILAKTPSKIVFFYTGASS